MKIFLLLLFTLPTVLFAQSSLSGKITDIDGYPIMGANVIAVNSETKVLDGFGISNENGFYSINLKNGTEFNIKVTFIGFSPNEFNITLTEDTIKNFALEEQAEALDEVELVYEMPVQIKGDTIVYSADAFNTGTEKKLADVLKNMPGIEVNDDGEIEVEGQVVRKIQIEGKDFFDGDTKLASQNLPAKAVGKVEVLRNFTENNQLRNVTNNEDNFALNIRLKDGQDKFWFGEIQAGTGPDDIHLLAPKIFYYSKNFNMSVLANSNDVGQPPLSRRDFYRFGGGFRNLNSGTGTSINISSDFGGIGNLQNNRAKKIESELLATNFTVSNDKGLNISGFSIFSSNINELEESITRTYFNNGIIENTGNNVLQKNELELYKFSVEYEPSDVLQMEYNILLNQSDQNELTDLTSIYGRQGSRVNENLKITNIQTPYSLNQEFKLYYTAGEKNIFSIEAQHLDQEEDPIGNVIREFNPFLNLFDFNTNQNGYNISQNRNVNTQKLEAKFDYYYLINDQSNINVTFGVTDVEQKYASNFFQTLDNGSFLNFTDPSYVNDVDFDFNDTYISLKYRLKTGIFTIDPGLTFHSYKSSNNQYSDYFETKTSDIRPDFRVNIQFKQSESLRLTYRETTQFTDVNNLSRAYVFNNYNSIFQGEPELEAGRVINYNLNYRSINQFTFTNVFAGANYSKRSNSIQSRTNLVGINSVRKPTNSTFPVESYSVNARIDKRTKNLRANLGFRLNFSEFSNVINDRITNSESFGQNYNVSLATNFRDKPNIEFGYRYNVNKYTNNDIENIFYQETPYVEVDAYFGKGFVFRTEYSYNYYKNQDQTLNNFRFWDADLSYEKEGSKWEYSVGVTNMLNDQSINRDSANQLSSQTRMYMIQPRYVLFKLKYDLTAFGGGSKKDDSSKDKSTSRPRGNAGGGKLK